MNHNIVNQLYFNKIKKKKVMHAWTHTHAHTHTEDIRKVEGGENRGTIVKT